MYSEDDLLPLSALQHLSFCERQWGLIHLEDIWEENPLTIEGNYLHDRSDVYGTEAREGVRTVRALRLRSLRLGITGKADVVEFHRVPGESGQSDDGDNLPSGVRLNGVPGRWMPFPVEYKRGRPKAGDCDEVQLCAQALCLEEMLGVSIAAGALFYGKTRRRQEVVFDDTLRERTEELAARLHELSAAGVTPLPRYGKWCARCSLERQCKPKVIGDAARVRRHLAALFSSMDDSERGGDR